MKKKTIASKYMTNINRIEFSSCLGPLKTLRAYEVRVYLQSIINKPCMAAHNSHPSTQDTEMGESL